ncbi:MAG: hypothetical protein M3O35_10145 [Acidobacteriota bacterium]|nr:hypothetical protein [Acidobacteriota bacterium]
MKIRTQWFKNASLLAFSIVMALPAVGLAQDTTPPTVAALSVSPSAVNTNAGPATVNVNFTLTDAGTGVYYLETALTDPTGSFVLRAFKIFTPSASVTDSVPITLPQFSLSGTWKIAYVFAADAQFNTVFLDSAGIAAAGFTNTTVQVSSTADTVPPALTAFSFTPATIDTTAASTNVTVNFTLTDDFAGANFFQVTFVSPSGDSSQSASKSFTPATSVSDSVTLTFPRFSEAGTWTVGSVFATDAAGNTLVLATPDLTALGFTTTLAVTSTSDTTPPTLTAFGFTPTTINVTGAPATVTVSYQVTDDLSGATTMQAIFTGPSGVTQTASATFPANISASGTAAVVFPKGSENGAWTVSSVFLSDASGNSATLATADLIAKGFPTQLTVTNASGDTTPPVITPTVSPAPNAFGWNTTVPVSVTWTVTDPESGVNTTSGCGATSVSAETAGVTFTCSATNNAGLTSSASVTVHIDLTPPVVTPSQSPAPNGAGWNNTDTTVSWSLSDPTSGIDSESGCGVITLTAETAGTSITCMATNGAGLSRSVTVTVKIDKTPPAAAATSSPAPNGAGWNNTNVTVTFTGADALSGIAGCTAPISLSSEGAGQSASGICTDNAGNNSSVATVSGINIDKTAPVTSNVVANPSTLYINHTTAISATVTDSGGSNVASAQYNIDGGSFTSMSGTFGGSTANVSATTPAFTTTGSHNVCVRGIDVAGNIGATTCVAVPVFTAAAPASGTTCNGAYNGTFNGSIVVSNGQVCDYEGTVTGSIQQGGGTLILLNATIGGSVQVTSGGTFSVKSSTISGSLQVTSLPTGTAVNQVCATHIKGSLQVTSSGAPVHVGEASGCAGNTIDNSLQVQSNTAQTLLIGNRVGGSLQDNNNTTSASPATQVTNNVITNALQCSGNSSITGGGNTASVKQGQCSAF